MQRSVGQFEDDGQDVERITVAAPTQPAAGRRIPGVLRVPRVADELLSPESDRWVVDRRYSSNAATVGGHPKVRFQVVDYLIRSSEVGSIANDETLPARPTDTAVSQPPGVTRQPGQHVQVGWVVGSPSRRCRPLGWRGPYRRRWYSVHRRY